MLKKFRRRLADWAEFDEILLDSQKVGIELDMVAIVAMREDGETINQAARRYLNQNFIARYGPDAS